MYHWQPPKPTIPIFFRSSILQKVILRAIQLFDSKFSRAHAQTSQINYLLAKERENFLSLFHYFSIYNALILGFKFALTTKRILICS